MELFQEILCHVLANESVHASFPGLLNTDAASIVELECYKALRKIKAILDDDALEDIECFHKIEEIICVLEDLGSSGGSRHDWG